MSFLTWLYGDAENAQRAAEADAALRALNEAQYGTDYVMVQDRLAGQDGVDPWVPPAQQEQQVNDAFAQGWQEGKDNVSKTVGGVFGIVGDVLSSVLLGIPAWVWLIGAGALWFWLGAPGLEKLKRSLK
jgi:hypothetical protein